MADWKPVARVGAPEVKDGPVGAKTVTLFIGTVPTAPPAWKQHFHDKLAELGYKAQFNYKHSDDGEGMHITAPEESFERAVGAVDEAIEYANQRYETTDLPFELQARQHEIDMKTAEARRLAALDARAARLAKPGEPIWMKYRREHE
ncbi:hypothetical protein [Mycolicibacterium iranicum]|uniref:Uncharacterized protein n=1 Tax=Mycolicibacterium iranicum TaxID=912594 RepID=A0ABT4HPP1_MYCIR|nr:hypothetical protein [Mycolicibacterium iranicum]MCZ0732207.1 hypothetical protein [Mycolicibacterium iranicum]